MLSYIKPLNSKQIRPFSSRLLNPPGCSWADHLNANQTRFLSLLPRGLVLASRLSTSPRSAEGGSDRAHELGCARLPVCASSTSMGSGRHWHCLPWDWEELGFQSCLPSAPLLGWSCSAALWCNKWPEQGLQCASIHSWWWKQWHSASIRRQKWHHRPSEGTFSAVRVKARYGLYFWASRAVCSRSVGLVSPAMISEAKAKAAKLLLPSSGERRW